MPPRRSELLDCQVDATALGGLRALSAEHIAAGALTVALRQVAAGPRVPLAGWLRGGAGERLLPQANLRDAYRAERASASRWLPWLGDTVIGRIDERQLGVFIAARAASRGGTGARAAWTGDCRRLRKWVHLAQAAAGMRPLVSPRWKVLPPGGKAPAKRVDVSLGSLVAALTSTRSVQLRAAIALALGCRLLVSELTALRVEDINIATGMVDVRDGCRRGRGGKPCARALAMPAWCRDLVALAVGARGGRAWLLARAGKQPSRWSEKLRRASERAGVEPSSLDDVRRLGQAIARPSGLPRAAVRSSVVAPAVPGLLEGAGLAAADAQSRLAHAWSLLQRPPHAPVHLPRRAPPGCGAAEPELTASRRRARVLAGKRGVDVADLPLSCLDHGSEVEALHAELQVTRERRVEAEARRDRAGGSRQGPPVVRAGGEGEARFTVGDLATVAVTFGVGGAAVGVGIAQATAASGEQELLIARLRAGADALLQGTRGPE